MRYIAYEQEETYPVVILLKESSFQADAIESCYTKPLEALGIPRNEILVVSLAYQSNGKAPKKHMVTVLDEILEGLAGLQTKYIYCADANFFKVLAKTRKADPYMGYEMPCKYESIDHDFSHLKVILGLNHHAVMRNPGNQGKLDNSLESFADAYHGKPNKYSSLFLKDTYYPKTEQDIHSALLSLHQYPFLALDIETASLDHTKAGIATVAFSWNETDGIAFPVDYRSIIPIGIIPDHGIMSKNDPIRKILKEFLKTYKGKLRYHSCTFDTKILIHELWMENSLDTAGLIEGLYAMHKYIDDTKVISYLALNSITDVPLDLKSLAQEYAGNYAVDVKNVLKVPLPDLLQYNLIDSCCTNWVYNKYEPIMIRDNQLDIYTNIMMPSQRVITHVELTGMPINPDRVQQVKLDLQKIRNVNLNVFLGSPDLILAEEKLRHIAWVKDFKDRQDKAKHPDKIIEKDFDTFPNHYFNPNSGKQLQVLLFEVMGLPILEYTDTGQASTGAGVIDSLINHTNDTKHISVLKALIGYTKTNKILTTFITAFETAIKLDDSGIAWLFGNFNLGGTVSGRLSSSKPNLQNLPSGSTYGKLVKSCFQPPEDWLFCGADFNSLEDMISALITRDPNKLKVYTDGYDGHSLRTFKYFGDDMPDIIDTVESINSIKHKYPKKRESSKTATFALTYAGTFHALVNQCGFTLPVAKTIESNYHELYQVSDKWVQNNLDQASKDGYITVAFGLRVRTPLLGQTIRNHSSTPNEAKAECRTAGNAMGQSYGLLNNRALIEFMNRVYKSKYALSIKPSSLIHDALYFVVVDDLEVLEWFNNNLIECMQWQYLPAIQHPTVRLGAELDIHYKDWSQSVTIPNGASREEIHTLCKAGKKKYEAS